MAEHVVRPKTYLFTWVALMLLTGATAGISFIELGQWNGPVALAIAFIKTLTVALIFMHLKYEKQKMVWVFALVGVFWLSILLLLSLTDYITRGFLGVAGK